MVLDATLTVRFQKEMIGIIYKELQEKYGGGEEVIK